MQKRRKKKLFVSLSIFFVVLLVTGVLATASDASETVVDDQKEGASNIPSNIYNYIQDFAKDNGINSENINDVSAVDFNSLPKEVNIENINDANLAIYQINYTNPSGNSDKLFVITYAVEKLNAQGDLIIAQDKREFLNFGFSKNSKKSVFLDTATGVEGGLDNGYVMMREGSITGLSTSLEALNGKGNIEVVIYVNGKQAQFGNSFAVDSSGVKKDYDVQSKDTVSFKQGDVISVYLKSDEGIEWTKEVTLLEITTNN